MPKHIEDDAPHPDDFERFGWTRWAGGSNPEPTHRVGVITCTGRESYAFSTKFWWGRYGDPLTLDIAHLTIGKRQRRHEIVAYKLDTTTPARKPQFAYNLDPLIIYEELP